MPGKREHDRARVTTSVEGLRAALAALDVAESNERSTTATGAGLGHYFSTDSIRPGVADYRLRESGLAVWTVIAALRAADGDAQAVASAYAIPVDHVYACIGLLLRHPLPILGRITDEDDIEILSAETR